MKHLDQRVGVFIDTQNMYYSGRHLHKRKVNFKNIVEDGVAGRKLIRAMAYVVATKGAEERPFFDALEKSGIELREKDLIEYSSGQKKADWDVGLAVDVIRTLDMLDVVVIASGDGDFMPLVAYCQSRGRVVELISFGETTSSNLHDMVDDYINLSENKRRYLIGPVEKKPRAPIARKTSKSDEAAKEEIEDEEEGSTGGFFMDTDKPDDQEESRSRRLQF
jgi:uncharacterized LabA/DUF88 family protein